MTPAAFPQANTAFHAPNDLDESQVATIPAFVGKMQGGNMDGADCIATAWQPTSADLEAIAQGKPVFLVTLGVLPPHFLTTKLFGE